MKLVLVLEMTPLAAGSPLVVDWLCGTVFLVVRAAFRNRLWCSDEKANFVSKHPNKQVLTDGLLLKLHITPQLVSVSPADVSQEDVPTACSGALSFHSTPGCSPRRSPGACLTHRRMSLGTTQTSGDVFLMALIKLSSWWSLMVVEQGKQRSLCRAAAAISWFMTREKCPAPHEAEQETFQIP